MEVSNPLPQCSLKLRAPPHAQDSNLETPPDESIAGLRHLLRCGCRAKANFQANAMRCMRPNLSSVGAELVLVLVRSSVLHDSVAKWNVAERDSLPVGLNFLMNVAVAVSNLFLCLSLQVFPNVSADGLVELVLVLRIEHVGVAEHLFGTVFHRAPALDKFPHDCSGLKSGNASVRGMVHGSGSAKGRGSDGIANGVVIVRVLCEFPNEIRQRFSGLLSCFRVPFISNLEYFAHRVSPSFSNVFSCRFACEIALLDQVHIKSHGSFGNHGV